VATRPKYIYTYKAVLMRAKLICETNNRDGETFKGRVCAGKGCVDTTNVRPDRRIEHSFLSRDDVCQK
jgi:hypothetical protein